MAVRVLAIDPGGTTGWALLDTVTRVGESGVCIGHEWEHADEVLAMVLERRVCDVLVIEDFNLRVSLSRGAASKRDTLSPVRVTEAITYGLYREATRHVRREDALGLVRGIGEGPIDRRWATQPGGRGSLVVKQSPADAMGFATDERLRTWGLYVTPVHARDAMRHAVLYASRHRDEAQAGEDVRRAAGVGVRGTRRKRR